MLSKTENDRIDRPVRVMTRFSQTHSHPLTRDTADGATSPLGGRNDAVGVKTIVVNSDVSRV